MKLLQQYFLTAFLFWSIICLNEQYYFYDDVCFDFYATYYLPMSTQAELSDGNSHQIIPFCLHDSFADGQLMVTGLEVPSVTFDELNTRNISSLQLLYAWSIHMELVEEYQAFRENKRDIKTVALNSSIYNCSSIRKFGRYCQYSLDTEVSY